MFMYLAECVEFNCFDAVFTTIHLIVYMYGMAFTCTLTYVCLLTLLPFVHFIHHYNYIYKYNIVSYYILFLSFLVFVKAMGETNGFMSLESRAHVSGFVFQIKTFVVSFDC